MNRGQSDIRTGPCTANFRGCLWVRSGPFDNQKKLLLLGGQTFSRAKTHNHVSGMFPACFWKLKPAFRRLAESGVKEADQLLPRIFRLLLAKAVLVAEILKTVSGAVIAVKFVLDTGRLQRGVEILHIVR